MFSVRRDRQLTGKEDEASALTGMAVVASGRAEVE
jgi:hypothetical protein